MLNETKVASNSVFFDMIRLFRVSCQVESAIPQTADQFRQDC